jgi:hypothetical protein
LSPAHDIDPVPQIDQVYEAQTPISENEEEQSIDSVLRVAPRFSLKKEEAECILKQLLATVNHWRAAGRKMRFRASALDAYATAFENPLINEACRKAL